MKKRIGIWFKNDLRLSDHPALQAALSQEAEIVPFFCLDPAVFFSDESGLRRMGVFRAAFLIGALKALDADLRLKGSGLLVCLKKASEAVPELAKEWALSEVFTMDEFGTEEIAEIRDVQQRLMAEGKQLRMFPHELLLPPDQMPFSLQKVPDIFSEYRRKAEMILMEESYPPAPERIHSPVLPELVIPGGGAFGFSVPEADPRTAFPFAAGEAAALKRLRYYGEESRLLSVYKETRNGLLGSDYSSKLSPWLACGNISARMVYAEVRRYERNFGSNQSTYWLVFELRWRDFFRLMMLKYGSRMFKLRGFQPNASPPAGRNPKQFARWKNGETGQPLVDAAMRELKATGFMSNRMRQVVASYLIDYLKLDWRLGAAWFEEQLIDYDVSSNWCNWAYQAGVGNDPRGKRVFNPERQAEMYDPEGSFRKCWLEN